MMQDLFNCLPPEIITNILLRLPVDAIASSKCVCKPWRDLLDTDYFVQLHLSKSLPFLAVMSFVDPMSSRCQSLVFDEFYDVESPDLQYSQVFKFDFPQKAAIIGAANGLLLLSTVEVNTDTLYICNPITRRYVEISGPKKGYFCPLSPPSGGGAYGFGVSRISGQFKVVWISPNLGLASGSKCCRVCTLGTGSWRRVEAAGAPLLVKLTECVIGAFLDGNLHWTVTLNMDKPLITCFDLETECFSSFGAPASRGGLSVLSGCLCFCEWKDEEIAVWFMKEYGVEKSWSKDYVIAEGVHNNDGYGGYNDVFPITVFENGDMLLMLMLSDGMCFTYYSSKTKTFRDYSNFDAEDNFDGVISSTLFTPSFQSLKGLGMENIILF